MEKNTIGDYGNVYYDVNKKPLGKVLGRTWLMPVDSKVEPTHTVDNRFVLFNPYWQNTKSSWMSFSVLFKHLTGLKEMDIILNHHNRGMYVNNNRAKLFHDGSVAYGNVRKTWHV